MRNCCIKKNSSQHFFLERNPSMFDIFKQNIYTTIGCVICSRTLAFNQALRLRFTSRSLRTAACLSSADLRPDVNFRVFSVLRSVPAAISDFRDSPSDSFLLTYSATLFHKVWNLCPEIWTTGASGSQLYSPALKKYPSLHSQYTSSSSSPPTNQEWSGQGPWV